jgi:hypothetical protein
LSALELFEVRARPEKASVEVSKLMSTEYQ